MAKHATRTELSDAFIETYIGLRSLEMRYRELFEQELDMRRNQPHKTKRV